MGIEPDGYRAGWYVAAGKLANLLLPQQTARVRSGSWITVWCVRVCVFCGSSPGRGKSYLSAAETFGQTLAEAGVGLVYGGASVGTMGALADAALAAGGRVYGVIPRQLIDREVAHPNVTELFEVADMHQRKAKMAELADGFVALPGGAGTLEELFEVWTWSQLGLHDKPVGLLDVQGYYQKLSPMLEHMVGEGFLRSRHRNALQMDADPHDLLVKLAEAHHPEPKWTQDDAPDAHVER